MELFGRPVTAPAAVETELAELPRPAALQTAAPSPRTVPGRSQTLEQARVLAQRIAECLAGTFQVQLTVHDNRSTMVSFRRKPPVLQLRLHHMFLEAPEVVVVALAEYAGRNKRAAGTVIDDYIASHEQHIREQRTPTAPLEARGDCYDLQVIFNDLNTRLFQAGIQATIGWGRHSGRRRKRSIRLGVYDHKAREIRIHPALDRPDVPLYFVEFVVFHEMLHQLFPSARDSGRNVHHPRAFRDRERAFPQYAVAMQWEREHLPRLLRR